MAVPSHVAEAIVEAGRRLDALGLVPATAGNFSIRLDARRLAVTVSGRHKGFLTPDDVMAVDLEGRAEAPLKRSSAETLLHCGIYRRFPEAGAVLHGHSIANTVLSRAAGNGLRLAGYELLSDDTVVLEPQGARMRPLPFAICLKRGSWEVLRRAGATGLDRLAVHERLDGREARYLAPAAVSWDPREIGALVVPAWRAGAEPRLRRLAPPDAMRALLPQYFPILAPLDGDTIGRAAALATGLPCFELSYDALADGVRMLGEALAA